MPTKARTTARKPARSKKTEVESRRRKFAADAIGMMHGPRDLSVRKRLGV